MYNYYVFKYKNHHNNYVNLNNNYSFLCSNNRLEVFELALLEDEILAEETF